MDTNITKEEKLIFECMTIVDTLFVNKFDGNKLILNNAIIKKRVSTKIIELKQENEKLKEQLKEFEQMISILNVHEYAPEKLFKHYKKLKEQLKDANEVIGFYGDKGNWNCQMCNVLHKPIAYVPKCDTNQDENRIWGGKQARKYLTKYKV